MDQLLKAYAEKRRQESGPSREMHPATRGMLQSEVTRVFAKPPAAAKSWFHLSWSFWPQLAAAGTLVVLFALSGLLFLHSRKPPGLPMELTRHDAKKAEATPAAVRAPAIQGVESDEKQKEDAAILKPSAAPTAMILAKKTETHFQEKKSFEPKGPVSDATAAKDAHRTRAMDDVSVSEATQAAVADRAANVEGEVPATPATTPKPVVAQTAAPSRPPAESRREIAGALQQPAGDTPAKSSEPSALFRTMRFAQNDLRFGERPAKKSAPKFQILAAFQVEERGNEIRIVDSDGSVYVGEIDRNAMITREFSALGATSAKGPSPSRDKESPERSQEEYDKGTVERQAARGRNEEPGFSFRAKGDCRSLKLRLEIRGRLVAENAMPQSQAGAARAESKEGASAFRQQPSTGVRIHAEASMESGEKLELDAWRVEP
ncbi:MAG: hypothetical protein HY360_14000 [Verrucomicrobia bacterium]|nr:hypothetical protein [Verrucomicrobiota bacterium]